MITLVLGSIFLSLLHAIIPNHWLPIVAIGKKEKWSLGEVLQVTAISGLSHVASTLFIGWGLAFFGWEISQKYQSVTPFIAPIMLIIIGVIFIYRHHRHKHFHVADQHHQSSKFKMIASLSLAMFFSPCLEVEGYFLAAGAESFSWIVVLSVLYFFVTLLGMVSWVAIAYHGLNKFNWHALEHKAGIIAGVTLITSGIISFFLK
jgi:putative Mn2+ efflux pump MntP